MKPQSWVIVLAIALAACAGATAAPPSAGAPTATLRSLPSPTGPPVFTTTLPTEPPLPTFTPLPTATPMAYAVQKGDTLIGIAVRNGLSIEALEAANPGIDPGNLQIGQMILIPPVAGGLSSNQALLPTPLAVAVAPFNCLPSPVGSLICLGEFINTLTAPAANVSVKVSLMGPDGSVTLSQVAYSPLTLIEPGQAVPLGVVFKAGAARQALAAVITADSGAGLRGRYLSLTAAGAAGRATPAGFLLSATITNPTTQSAPEVTIVGTVYNAGGAVTGYRVVKLPGALAAGESLSFEMSLPGVVSAARWVVIAQGRIP